MFGVTRRSHLLTAVGALLFLLSTNVRSQTDDPPLAPVPLLHVTMGDFVENGADRCAVVSLTNFGSEPLKIRDMAWADDAGYSFGAPPEFPYTIEAGEALDFDVCFATPGAELPNDILEIRSNSRTGIAWGFIADASNSMDSTLPCGDEPGPRRIEAAQTTLKRFLNVALSDILDFGIVDHFMVASYSSERFDGHTVIPFYSMNVPLTRNSAAAREEANRKIDSIELVGGTWTGHALRETIKALSESPLRHRIIVIATDGQTNDPDIEANPREVVIQEAKDAGVRVIAVRIGTNSFEAESYLKELVEETNGLYFVALNCEEFYSVVDSSAGEAHRESIEHVAFPSGIPLSAPDSRRRTDAAGSISITEISPNPASDYLDLNITSAVSGFLTLSLHTTTGEIVLTQTERFPGGGQSAGMRIETAGLPPGAYILTVTNELGGSAQRKVVLYANSRH